MAKKGDTLTDFITAGFYNDVVKKLRLNVGPRGKGQVDQNQFVTVYNHEAVFRKPWEAVSLGTPKVTYNVAIDDRHSEIGFNTKALSASDPHNLAILQEPLPPEIGASALALIVGSSWLRMPLEGWGADDDTNISELGSGYSANRQYIKIGSGNTLDWSTSGRIEALRDFDIAGPGLAFVVIGKLTFAPRINWVGYLHSSYRGVVIGFWVVPSFALDGKLPTGAQWVVNLYKWNFGIAGATVRVEYDPENDRWIPLQQQYICPDGRTIAEPPPPPPAAPPT